MNLKTVFLAAALLMGAAQAQLFGTAAQMKAQPILQEFTGDNALTRAQARIELDRVGERVVGVYVTAPKADTDSVARAILAAWGASPEAVPNLQSVLNDPGFQKLAAGQVFEELDASGSSAVYIRLRGNTWHAYTALKVYPVSRFPGVSAPLGKPTAPARLDIISDYECPYCNMLWKSTSMAAWRGQPDVFRLNYHHFPLSMHPRAVPAAIYAECAAEQGRFWEFSDRLNSDFGA